MVKMKEKFYKYWSKQTKKGMKRVVRDSKGRIRKWEDADSLDMPKGEYKIVEYVINFIPTKTHNYPSDNRKFEIRLRLPYGSYDKDELISVGKDILTELTNEEMVDTSMVEGKFGADFIKFSNDDSEKWSVVDRARPQFHYPKESTWGDI